MRSSFFTGPLLVLLAALAPAAMADHEHGHETDGPLAQQTCLYGDEWLWCKVGRDTEEFSECSLDFARTLPGDVQLFVQETIKAAQTDVHNLKCFLTNTANDQYSNEVHPLVLVVECQVGGPYGNAGGVCLRAYDLIREQQCAAIQRVLPNFTCPAQPWG